MLVPVSSWPASSSPAASFRSSRRLERGPLALLLAAALCLAAASALAGAWGGQARARLAGGELQLFPNGPWVRPLCFGRARLVADLAWLQAIQYYGAHRLSDRRYPFTHTLFQTMVGLDPQFENAYVLGALILDQDVGRTDAATALLEEGIRANPESWRLAFELGFLHYSHAVHPASADEAGPHLAAAVRRLRQAGSLPGAPETVGRLAAYAAGRAGDPELALLLWREALRHAPNDEVRRIAERYIQQWESTGARSSVLSEVPR